MSQRRQTQLAAFGGFGAGVAGALVADRPLLAVLVSGGFLAVLAAVSLVDLRERRIPNAWTYPAFLGALLAAIIAGPDIALAALGGLALTGGFFVLMFVLGRGRLGFGDVKLGALSGVVLGIAGAPLFLVAGTGAGAIAALLLLLRGAGPRATFAYGPSLAAGAAFAVLLRGPVVS